MTDNASVSRQVCGNFGNDKGRLMDILIGVQAQAGCIAPEALDEIAKSLSMNRVEVESAATFYAFFSDKMRGRFVIRLCNDVIDQLQGADRVAAAFRAELGIEFGQTTADGLFSLAYTPCIGMSDQAPAVLINDRVVTKVSTDMVREIVQTLRTGKSLEHLKLTLGDGNNSHPLVRAMVNNNLRERGAVVFAPYTPGVALQRALSEQPVEIIKIIKASRLRGRGGAGFPTGMKWEFTRAAPGERKFVVCNADEGEPGTFKDRVILTEAPGLVFEGMTIAGYAVGASEGIVYLRGEYAYLLAYLEDVLAKRRAAGLLGRDILGKAGFKFDIRIQLGAGAYVCGEETALLSSCEGKAGNPKTRPPFPAQKGYLDMPTVINNVETHCAAARIVENGPSWFASMGTKASSGTKVFSVSGDCAQPGVYEIPFGITVQELLARVGATDTIAVQVGGASGRMIGPSEFGRQFCFDQLATGGSVMVFGKGRDPLAIAHGFMDFFVEESCGYCTPCRVGTRLLRERLGRFLEGRAEAADLDYLEKTSKVVKNASRCGLGQTAPNPILSTLQSFRSEYERCIKKNGTVFLPSFDPGKAVAVAAGIAGRASEHFGTKKGGVKA
ncbi:MAG: NAD(P)H-dependent oxidoreductase subunit E [Deltaproteobacteria bacterium]|nr:NAD(P)H-dependent oxidoreductase subunit E [Deltaproteobacteria bacterium]